MCRRLVLLTLAVASVLALAGCSHTRTITVTKTVFVTVTPTPTPVVVATPVPTATPVLQVVQLNPCSEVNNQNTFVASSAITTIKAPTQGLDYGVTASFPVTSANNDACDFTINQINSGDPQSIDGSDVSMTSELTKAPQGASYCHSVGAPACSGALSEQYDVKIYTPLSGNPNTARKGAEPLDCNGHASTFAGQSSWVCPPRPSEGAGTVEIVFHQGKIYRFYAEGDFAQQYLKSVRFTS